MNQTIIEVLKKISRLLEGHDVKWVVIGSTSLALQGLDIQPEDIDIISTKEDTIKIAEILKEFESKPVKFGRTHLFESYLGVYEIDGIKVEVMGDFREKRGNEWVSLNDRLILPVIIEIDNTLIPVSQLEDQLISYEKIGRPRDSERAKKIRRFLRY